MLRSLPGHLPSPRLFVRRGDETQRKQIMDTLFINIGTVTSCLFVKMSLRFLKLLQRNPLLYFAVEEALECAKIGYYGIGIIAFSQILNSLNKTTPASRHVVAHELLRHRPDKYAYECALENLKMTASEQSERELGKSTDKVSYRRRVAEEWHALVYELHSDRVPSLRSTINEVFAEQPGGPAPDRPSSTEGE